MKGPAPDTNRPPVPQVLTVVVNWNGGKHLERCLASLDRVDYPPESLSVLVVDNASTSPTVSGIEERFPSVSVLRNPHNLEFVRAANQGARIALEDGAAYVWILNNDVIVPPDTLRLLVAEAERDDSNGILSPVIETPGLTLHGGYRIHFRTGILSTIDAAATGPSTMEVDAVLGCALLVRTEVLRQVGLFPEIYRAYFEEVEYQVRARHAGFRVLSVRTARVLHSHAASYDRRLLRRAYLLLRNLFLFECRNARIRELAVFLPYFLFAHLPYFLVRGTVHTVAAWRKRRRTPEPSCE